MINLRIKWPTRYEVMSGAQNLKSKLMLRRRWFGFFWQDFMLVENLIRKKEDEMNKAYDAFVKLEEEYKALLREARRAQESVDNARDCGIGKGPIEFKKMPWRRKGLHKLMPEQDTRWKRFQKVLKGRSKGSVLDSFIPPGGSKIVRVEDATIVEDSGEGMPEILEGTDAGMTDYNTDFVESRNQNKKNNNQNNGGNNQNGSRSGHIHS